MIGFRRLSGFSAAIFCLALSCGPQDESTDGSIEGTSEALNPAPRLIQRGAGLQALGITSDGAIVYADGQTIKASFSRGGNPIRIAEAPAGVSPFVRIRGRTVFVWTNPTSGISPLVVWSAIGGVHVASNASPVQPSVTESNTLDSEIVYSTNASADGTTADLVVSTRDFSKSTVLLKQVSMGPNYAGTCFPLAGFGQSRSGEAVIAAYCQPGASSATVSIFPNKRKQVLVTGEPKTPRLTVSPNGRHILTRNAQRQPLLVDAYGNQRILDSNPLVGGSWGDNETIIFVVADSAGTFHMKRASTCSSAVTEITDKIASFSAFITGIKDRASSPDGRFFSFVSKYDPQTGISDQFLLDTRARQQLVLETQQQTLLAGTSNPFTGDSKSFVYFKKVNASTFTSPIAAYDLKHGERILSDDLGAVAETVGRSCVAFVDHTNLQTGTGDLSIVDLNADVLKPKKVMPSINLPLVANRTSDRIAFTTPQGLYVAFPCSRPSEYFFDDGSEF